MYLNSIRLLSIHSAHRRFRLVSALSSFLPAVPAHPSAVRLHLCYMPPLTSLPLFALCNAYAAQSRATTSHLRNSRSIRASTCTSAAAAQSAATLTLVAALALWSSPFLPAPLPRRNHSQSSFASHTAAELPIALQSDHTRQRPIPRKNMHAYLLTCPPSSSVRRSSRETAVSPIFCPDRDRVHGCVMMRVEDSRNLTYRTRSNHPRP